jgi:glycerol-3-phosphate acyltransferase PlsY
MLTQLAYPVALVVGYLLGSIPTGAVIARLYGNVDITRVGSGKTGTTNVLRALGPGAAAAAFAGDVSKGAIAVLIALTLNQGTGWPCLVAGAAAVLGHTYSLYIGFRGGRGVAPAIGATLVVAPVALGIGAVVAVGVVAVTRYVSLGSVVGTCVAALVLIVTSVIQQDPLWAVWGILVGGLVVVAHRDNLQRLRTGQERKLGEKAALG